MKIRNWATFINERFNPFSYGTMILLVALAHMLILLKMNAIDWIKFPVLLLFFACFFFKMRCYDEIKDFEHDRVFNPTRPLARGLLSKASMAKAIVFCWIAEISLMSLICTEALFYVFPVMCYTLLMYKEFFIGEKLRPHLTTYAMLHTLVFFLLSLALLHGIGNKDLSQQADTMQLLLYALPHWFLFNLFEFARKTFASEEEKEDVLSYSKIFGRIGAALLSISQIILAYGCFYALERATSHTFFASIFDALLFAIIIFATISFTNKDTATNAKFFRLVCQITIIYFYVCFCIRFV